MLRVLVMALTLAVTAALSRPADAQFKELVSRVPSTANGLVLLNIKKILSSPQAARENWKEKLDQAFAAGMIFLPPSADYCVLASQRDFESFEPVWEMAIMDLNNTPSLPLIARQYKGLLETVAGTPAVSLPDNRYLVSLGPKTVGTLSPANRQELGRWIRGAANGSRPTVSPYLQSALGYAEEVGTEIILALDLADTFDVANAREKLDSSTVLKGKKVDVEELAKVLVSLKGMMLGIRTGEKVHGMIKVDFGADVSLMADFAKPLLLEVLANHGLKIDEFDGWKAATKGKRFSIEGDLTPAGLRRVLSVVDAPAMPATTSEQTESADEPAGDTFTAESSRKHFRSIQELLRDLQADRKDSKTLGQSAGWFEIYAKRIDRLAVLGVDPDVLNYSAYVSQQLRAASSAYKGVGIKYGAQRASINSAGGINMVWDPGYGYYSGYNSARATGAQRDAAFAQLRAEGATSVVDIMHEVDKATVQVRQAMTARFKVEF